MTDTDSDISDSEGTWVDDVRNVDWCRILAPPC